MANGAMIPALESRVDPDEHLLFEWEAFWLLFSDRQISMGGVGPIPWSAVDRYAERNGINDPDSAARFHRLIRAMDNAYLERAYEKAKGD